MISPRFLFLCLVFLSSGLASKAWSQPIDFDHANLSFFRDKSGKKQRVLNKEHWNVRRQQILEGMQTATGKFPPRPIGKVKSEVLSESRLDDSIAIRTIQIEVTEKTHVVADLYLPVSVLNARGNYRKHPAILALHPTGAPGKRIIGGASPRKNRQYANELAKRGYIVIAPDYPSFGDLKNHNFENDELPSGTMQGILNHMRCVDFLVSKKYVNANRIGVIGHSLGGHNAIFVAAFDQRLKAIVTSCGWTPFHDYYGGKIAGWTSTRYMPLLKTKFELNPDKVPFDFYELIASLAPRPFYTNSPLLDSNFDVNGVKKAIPKIKQVYSLFDAENKVHAVFPKCQHDFPSEIRDESYRFLDNALGHKPTGQIGFAGELPRIKPLEPEDSLKSFNNSDVQLAASEPIVHDPIAMSFDERQRLFVIEMKGYSEQDKDNLGRVRMLQDKNRDGVFESSTVFADGLSWPTALICYGRGVFVAAAPDIWFFEDIDGDGKSDMRKKVFTGFGKSNVQGLVNCLRWGMDNRIHGAASSSGGMVYRAGKDPKTAINLRGADFSFDPKTLDLRRETGGAQHGMSFDDFGNKYVCSNSDHAQAVLFDDRYLSRNPYAQYARARKSIAADGGQAPVFRASPVEPWRIVRTRLRVAGRVPGPVEGGGTAAGYFTGSTGITIYRGDAGSVEKGVAIIGDVGSNIVHRKKILRDGLDVSATRIDKNSELITSKDIWFRPVQFGHGPDGCLYILDMYREVIEHPKSLPPMIKRHLDLTEGRDRGRIYRLGKPKLKRAAELNEEMSAIDLVPFLNHPNSWHRETAARLIFQKQDQTCTPALRNVRVNGFGPVGKVHALWSLYGLKALKFDDVMTSLRDVHPEVRRHAVLLAEKSDRSWLEQTSFTKLENDPDIRVRLQLAFSIGELAPQSRTETLWRLIRRSKGHPIMMTAIMSSSNDRQSQLVRKLALTSGSMDPKVKVQFLTRFIRQLAKRNRSEHNVELANIIQHLIKNEREETAWELLSTIKSVNSELAAFILGLDENKSWYHEQKKQALITCQDLSASPAQRLTALMRLAIKPDKESINKSLKLISIDQPLKVQLAAIQLVGQSQSDEFVDMLISKRGKVGREASAEILKQLLANTSRTRRFLESAKVSDFPPGQLEILSRSSDTNISSKAKKLLASSGSKDFETLMATYRSSLTMLGDTEKGRAVFEKSCSRCHRAGDIGFEIGPNLATMKSRGKESVLTNILAPNREVNPSFTNYLIETADGRTFSGMIDHETETTITLKKEKKETIEITKSDIEAIKNTGLSLMPTGLEKEISKEQMADLLEFLMRAK